MLCCLSMFLLSNQVWGLPSNFTDSNGIEFVLIPAGSFKMGCDGFSSCGRDEEPQHMVTITKSFYISKYRVKQQLWVDMMGYNRSYGGKKPDKAVNQVSWFEVQEFIGKLNEQISDRHYRLPTEAEWEFAARIYSSELDELYDSFQEWCWDWYDYNYYKYARVEDPLGPKEGKYKVLRGGRNGLFSAGGKSPSARNGISPKAKASFRLVYIP